jgi:Lhr-like helicase
MARRAFRDIARVAGLVVQSLPGASRPSRQLQASSEMFFDVLTDFDPGNLLLDQSRREVLEAQLEVSRLRSALERTAGQTLLRRSLDRLSPLAFPIWAETLRATQVSSERWSDLVARMVVRMERVADGSPPPTRADRADAAVGLPQGVWERAAGPQADLPTARGRGRRRDATPDPRPSQESGDPTARTHARS